MIIDVNNQCICVKKARNMSENGMIEGTKRIFSKAVNERIG